VSRFRPEPPAEQPHDGADALPTNGPPRNRRVGGVAASRSDGADTGESRRSNFAHPCGVRVRPKRGSHARVGASDHRERLRAGPPILAPLKPVRDDLLVLSGLTLDQARAHGDGSGDHARAMAAFLTGSHPRKTTAPDYGPEFRSIRWPPRRLASRRGFRHWKSGVRGARATERVTTGTVARTRPTCRGAVNRPRPRRKSNPRLVFERLFGGPNPNENDPARVRRERERKSILDFVGEDAARVRGTLGAADRGNLTNT